MDDNVIKFAPLASRDLEGIAMTMERCRNVLAELQLLADKYGNKPFRFKSRVKFQLHDVKSIRERLRMALDGLNSFNSAKRSLSLKIDASQESILKTLVRIQADVQSGKREGSTISQAIRDGQNLEGSDVIEDVFKELEVEGISKQELRDNQSVITQWIRRGLRDGAWQELPPETYPSYPKIPVKPDDGSQITLTHQCKIEVLSASYGPMDVTDRMRHFLMTNVSASTKTRVFNVTNDFFGGDPRPGIKAFVLVWRKRLSLGGVSRYGYSEPQTLIVPEYKQAIFDYNRDAPPVDPESYSTSNLNILNATYHTQDVTSTVARLIQDPIKVSNAVFGDPHPGWKKVLVVTYSYGVPENILDCHTKICVEGSSLSIPPPLKIAAANFATTDITDILRAQVTLDQQLFVNLNKTLYYPDPAFGVSKTVAVMFQYGDEPLQLVVQWESEDVLKIEPLGRQQRNFINPMPPRADDAFHIIGGVWGVRPLDLKHFGLMQQREEFPCTNEWFGFDGRPDVKKTCLLFIWDPRNAVVKCLSAWEGEILKIGSFNRTFASLPSDINAPGDEHSLMTLVDDELQGTTPDETKDPEGGKKSVH
ncbi:MAG: hypothetical protein M1822_003720 [Bathelium mastoideum]|nr:MAG: hypothetical protein M1822_003720 [Bathelium mastoideum]